MKKFMLAVAVFAVASISLASCGGSNPADKAVKILNDATEQVKNAKSADEIMTISADVMKKMSDLQKENKDFEGTEADEKKVTEAGEAFQKACEEAAQRLGE